jgi:hypothetical protein
VTAAPGRRRCASHRSLSVSCVLPRALSSSGSPAPPSSSPAASAPRSCSPRPRAWAPPRSPPSCTATRTRSAGSSTSSTPWGWTRCALGKGAGDHRRSTSRPVTGSWRSRSPAPATTVCRSTAGRCGACAATSSAAGSSAGSRWRGCGNCCAGPGRAGSAPAPGRLPRSRLRGQGQSHPAAVPGRRVRPGGSPWLRGGMPG